MDLITPGIGTIFWTTLTFLMLLTILRFTAWKPIVSTIKERNKKIQDALEVAEKTKADMEKLKVENKQILEDAINERDQIISEAKEMKTRMLNDAKDNAQEEAHKIVEKAKAQIESEKVAAINEIKDHLVNLSVSVAEKVVKAKVKSDKEQERLIDEMLNDIKLN